MKLGDQPAFPIAETISGNIVTPQQTGMTYRQWLIGMIASGNASLDDIGNAEWVIAKADEIIDELEKEKCATTTTDSR